MPQNNYNIELMPGDTFSLNLTVKNSSGSLRNLSGHTAAMQIRPSYSSNTVTESLSTANGEISINTSSSTVSLTLSAARTAAINVDMNAGMPPRTRYVYDLELTDSANTVSKLMYGEVIVYGEVTR
mgnify:CR=1 FL=1